MPVFVAAFGGMLLNLVGTLAGRVLVALGISVVTYTGLSASLDVIKGQAIGAFGALPADMMAIIGLLKVGVCISIVSSAITARLVLSGLTGDTFKKWVHK